MEAPAPTLPLFRIFTVGHVFTSPHVTRFATSTVLLSDIVSPGHTLVLDGVMDILGATPESVTVMVSMSTQPPAEVTLIWKDVVWSNGLITVVADVGDCTNEESIHK